MVNFGILSTARIGREQLLPAIVQAEGACLRGIASRDPQKARSVALHFGIEKVFESYDELLDSPDVHAVYIPLPTSQHVEWSLKAIEAGKHVLSEKPIALQAKDIDALITARDKAGVIVSEAYMVTYHPQWLKVKNLIASGAIGRLRVVDASFSYFNKDADNMRNQPELGGGALPDIGVYPVVTARFATGQEPVSVSATVEYDKQFNIDSYANAQIAFADFTLNMYVSTQMAGRQSMVFHGEDGFIEVSAPFNSNLYEGDEVRLHNRGHTEMQVFRYTGVNQYQLQIEAFCRAVEHGKQPVYSLEDSKRNQKVIDAVYAAGVSGKLEAI